MILSNVRSAWSKCKPVKHTKVPSERLKKVFLFCPPHYFHIWNAHLWLMWLLYLIKAEVVWAVLPSCSSDPQCSRIPSKLVNLQSKPSFAWVHGLYEVVRWCVRCVRAVMCQQGLKQAQQGTVFLRPGTGQATSHEEETMACKWRKKWPIREMNISMPSIQSLVALFYPVNLSV